MSDDAQIKIMQSLGLDYSPAINSTIKFENSIKTLNEQLSEMKTIAMQSAKDVNTVFASQLGQVPGNKSIVDQYGNAFKTAKQEADKMQFSLKDNAAIIKQSTLEQMKSQAASVQQRAATKGLSEEYGKQAVSLREQLAIIQARLQSEGKLTAEEVKQTSQLKEQLEILRAQTRSAISDDTRENPSTLNQEFERRSSWFLTGTMFYGTINAAKEAKQTITDVEMGMVELARVMDDTSFVFDDYRDNLFKLGVDYGQTFDNVQSIALRWAQSGYNVADSLELTKTSLLALNTAELDATNATESMIGIMAQWQLQAEDMALVMDKINITADNYSITSQDLVDGLLRSSSAARNMNMSLDETIGLLTVMREASGRTGKEVGNALNSILSYVTRGKSIENLEGLGIQMFTDNTKTQFRNAMEIFQDIHSKWDSLSMDIQDGFVKSADDAGLFNEELANAVGIQEQWNDVQKRDASQSAAGTHRRNYFIGMIERMSNVQGVLNGMIDAEGYSMSENAKTMETLEKKQESLKISAEALAVAIGDAGLEGALKGLADGGTNALTFINEMPKGMKDLVLATTTTFVAVKALELGMKTFGIQLPGISQVIASLTSGTWSLTAALKAGGTGIATFAAANAPLLALSASIGVIVAVTNYMKKQREETEKAVEVFNQYKDTHKDLDDLISTYENLAGAGHLTTEELDKLATTKQKIIDLLPKSKEFIDNENLSLSEQIGIVKELNDQELERLRITAQKVLNKGESVYEKETKDLEELIKVQEKYNKEMAELGKKQRDGTATLDELWDLKELPNIMEKNREKIIELTDSTNAYENALKFMTDIVISNTNATDDNYDANSNLENQYGATAKSIEDLYDKVSTAVDEYDLFNQALKELNKEGQISKSTLDKLIEVYPNIIQMTGLQKDKMIELMNTSKNKRRQMIDDEIASAKATSEATVQRILNVKNEAEALKELANIKLQMKFIDAGNSFDDPTIDAQMQRNVENARQAMAVIDQTNRKIQALDGMRGLFDVVDKKYIPKDPKKEKEKKEEYKAIADIYERINQRLADNNTLIEKNKRLISETTDGTAEQFELIQKQNVLYKERQDLLNQLNIARRKERDELQKDLSKEGFKFTGSGDSARITKETMGNIEGKSKEVEEMFNRFNTLQTDIIPKTSEEWWTYQKTIVDNLAKIKDAIQSHIDELSKLNDELADFDLAGKIADLDKQLDTAKFNHWVESVVLGLEQLNGKSELLTFKLSLYDEGDFDGRAGVVGELFEASQEKLKAYREEWDKLSKQTPKNADEANKIAGAMKQVQMGMREAFVATRDYQRQLENLQFDAIATSFADANKQLEMQLNIINHNLQSLQDGVLSDFSIDMVMPTPDFSNIFNETASENERLYNDQVAYEKQIQDLKQWSLDEQLRESKHFYDEEVQKQLDHYKELLKKIEEKEKEIYALKQFADEEQKKLIDETNASIQEKIETSNAAIQTVTDTHLTSMETSYQTKWQSIVTSVQSSVDSIIADVNRANSAMSSMGSASGGGVPTNSSAGSSGKVKANADGKAPSGLSVGTVVETNGGNYKITGVNSNGSYQSEKIKKYAQGTNGHPKDGLALVGDERDGAYEMVVYPNGKATIMGKQGAELVNLPKGTHVIPHDETKEMLSNTIAYANGTSGNKDYFEGIKKPELQVVMSDEFKEGIGKYSEGLFELQGFKGYHDYLANRKVSMAEIKDLQQKYLDGTDQQIAKEQILQKIDTQMLDDAKNQSWLKIDLLEQMKSNVNEYTKSLQEQYNSAMESGNVELAIKLYEEINAMLFKQMDIENQITSTIKQRYDMEFALMDKKMAKEKQAQSTYQKQLSIIDAINPNDYEQILAINQKIIASEERHQQLLQDNIAKLIEQRDLLAIGSNEWNIINGQVEDYNDKLLDSQLLLIQQAKQLLKIQFDQQIKALEQSIFGGTEQEARDALDDKINAQNKYIDGLEKEIEIAKLKKFIQQNDLKLSNEQLAILNSQGKLERTSFERLQKQLEIKRLEQRLENLKQQKTKKQYVQKSDGTWDFEHVIDQDAIDDTMEELQNSQLDLIKFEQDVLNQQHRDELDAKSKHFNKMKKATEDALNGEYQAKEDFYAKIKVLVDEFLSILDIDVSESMKGLLESFNEFIEKLGGIKDATNNYKPPSNSGGGGSSGQIRYTDEQLAQDGLKYNDKGQIVVDTDGSMSYEEYRGKANTAFIRGDTQLIGDAVKQWTDKEPPKDMDDLLNDLIGVDGKKGSYNRKEEIKKGSAVASPGGYTGDLSGTIFRDEKYEGENRDILEELWRIQNSKFKDGGETQRTGIHWLDGKVGEPERILSAQQTKDFNTFTTYVPDLLKSMRTTQNLVANIRIPSLNKNSTNQSSISQTNATPTKIIHNHIGQVVFPGVKVAKEIEDTFKNLERTSLQYD